MWDKPSSNTNWLCWLEDNVVEMKVCVENDMAQLEVKLHAQMCCLELLIWLQNDDFIANLPKKRNVNGKL